MGHLFTDRQLMTLRAVCNALIPAVAAPDSAFERGGLYERAASTLHIAELIDEALPQVTDSADQQQFKLFLDALDQPFANWLLDSVLKSFAEMTFAEQTRVLRRWSESMIPFRRKAFQAVKRLTCFLFYSVLDEHGSNPNWEAVGYVGPAKNTSVQEKSLKPLAFTADTVLNADVVIIGSGAGGSVVAGELSAAGVDVIVLEKGGYYAEPDFAGTELAGNQRLYENQGFFATADLGVMLLAGSALGGGTLINWSASFRTPDNVTREWEQVYGVGGFTGKTYQKALDAISARLNVGGEDSQINVQNAILERGAQALGYETKPIPRNVKGCQECDFCTFGCTCGAKQSTLKTYLQDAYERGTRIAVNVHVEQVLVEYGRAIGVVGTAIDSEGNSHRLTVRAQAVVVSAGAIHTPALLMRSGLSNAHIGRNLHLHPTTVTFGLYDELVRGWQGPPMTRYVPQFSNLDGRGYGFILETAPIHPGIAASTLSWSDGIGHKRIMAQLDRLSNVIVIVRDQGGGRVTLSDDGKPIVHYALSEIDRTALVRGVGEALKIHTAAGANEVSGPQSAMRMLTFAPDAAETDRQAALQMFVNAITNRDWQPNRFALYSAHQMSSCRMGGSPARGALDPTGETFEVCNLFVADGSVLPTAVGCNPMLTIMAVSHVIAGHVKAKLKKD